MGLFDRAKPEAAGGRARVHSVSAPKEPAAMYHRVRLVLEVHLEGRAPYAATITAFAPHHKVPAVGDWVPVTVDPRNARRVRVSWDEVAGGAALPPPEPATAPTLDEVAPRVPDGAQRAAAVAAAAPPEPSVKPADRESPGDDIVGKLERLVRLRESGALSDEEFAAAKQRILDESLAGS